MEGSAIAGGNEIILQMLDAADERGASDIHIALGYPLMFRIDGALVPMPGGATEADEVEMLLRLLGNDAQREALARDKAVEFACSVSDGRRIRVCAFRERGACAMTLRPFPSAIPTPEELELPEAVVALTEKRRGLVLITGEAGSGKTTTMASLLGVIAGRGDKVVLSLERPIEYLCPQGRGMVLQREVGRDSESYADALRVALRQDADVIFVAEMRDAETIALAITVAESGRLVFGALHMGSAVAAAAYIAGIFPSGEFLTFQPEAMRARFAGVLEGIVAQQLLPMCGGGRVAAFETLLADEAVRAVLRECRLTPETAFPHGAGQTMDDALYERYMKSRISLETAVACAQSPEEMRRKIQIF